MDYRDGALYHDDIELAWKKKQRHNLSETHKHSSKSKNLWQENRHQKPMSVAIASIHLIVNKQKFLQTQSFV